MKVTKFEFSLFGINTYVVWDPATRDCAVIDPGMMKEDEEQALLSYVNREKLRVTHIINTHLHIDHAIGNPFAKKAFGAPVLAHKSDEPLGTVLKSQATLFGLSLPAQAVSIDQYIEDGDIIRIGEGELEAIHVPGHSPGSILLYDRKDGFVIAGDVLFNMSIGRTDLPGGNHDQLIEGIRTKVLTLPPQTIVYPGHGPETTIAAESRSNPFL